MADSTLINLCRQKITISRLRAAYGLSAEIPPLIANGDIDFESIDEKAIELLLHIARSSGWTIREYDMDMSVFTTDDDGCTLEILEEPYSSDNCDYGTILLEAFMENNPHIAKRECIILLYLMQNMLLINSGIFNDQHKAVRISKTFAAAHKNEIASRITALENFFQNSGKMDWDCILQSGYDIEAVGENATLSIYLLCNYFFPTSSISADPVNSFSYGFNWDNFDEYVNFIMYNQQKEFTY